jgi:hypothetical protein
MREIKFRAWNFEKMVFNCAIRNSLIVNHKDLFYQTGQETNYPIMQFTGLKDINRVDIYDGDHDKDYNVVTWCDKRNGWSFSAFDAPSKEIVFCNCYNCEGNFDFNELIEDFEVIGNIHQK